MTTTSSTMLDQFFIQVNGSDISVASMLLLEEAIVEDDLLQPAMFTLRFQDSNFTLIEGSTFALGAEVTLAAADGKGTRKTIMIGEVTALEPEFSPRYIGLVVRGYDKSHRLYRGVKTRAFVKKADSDIASQIAQEGGLTASATASGVQYEVVMQEGQTDMEFLRARAARIGYTVRYDGQKLFFGKAESSPPQAPVQELGVGLLSFRARLTAVGQPNSVEVRGWDGKSKAAIVGTASSATATSSIGYGKTAAAAAQQAFSSSAKLSVTDQPVQTSAEATKLAQAILDDIAGDYLSAEGLCRGEPTLKAGTKVQIKGVGTRFGGTYFVTATRHEYTVALGYQTTFTVNGRNPTSVVGALGSAPQRHLMHGVVPAVVTNVNDPDALGRVKVKYPWLNDQLESDWARFVQPGAGSSRGWFIPPEVNDEVLIAFEQGDINRPYVMGGLWNSKDKPPSSAVQNSKVVQRGLKTRAGHTIEIGEDDGGNKGYITIKTGNGSLVQISDTDKKIVVKSQKHTITMDDQGQAVKITSGGTLELSGSGNTLKFTQAGVELSGSGGKLNIAAAGIELAANANLTLKGNANVTVQANAMMEVKSSAITSIAGTLVKIN